MPSARVHACARARESRRARASQRSASHGLALLWCREKHHAVKSPACFSKVHQYRGSFLGKFQAARNGRRGAPHGVVALSCPEVRGAKSTTAAAQSEEPFFCSRDAAPAVDRGRPSGAVLAAFATPVQGMATAHTAWTAALSQLRDAPQPAERSEAIDQITELLQSSDWQLPDGLGVEVVAALRERLSDTNWCASPQPPAAPRKFGQLRFWPTYSPLVLRLSWCSPSAPCAGLSASAACS